MNKVIVCSIASALFAGCVTQYNEPPPPQAPRTVDVAATRGGGNGNAARPKRNGVRPSAGNPQAGKVAGWAERPLRVLVSLDDGKAADAPSTLKRVMCTNVEGALAASGYRVVYDKPAEILVYGRLSAQRINSRGTRVAWSGTVDWEVTRAPEVNVITGQKMTDVVAKKRFDAKSGDSRSDADAQRALADRLANESVRFAKDGVKRVGGKMRCSILTVANAWQPQDAPGYPTLFTQRVSAMPGVYSCRVLSTDNAARSMTAEVIFDVDAYPDGFVNRLYLDRELNIVR